MKEIKIYTDGSNSIKAKVIGYAFKIIFPNNHSLVFSGAMEDYKGTCDRAELYAVLRALQKLYGELSAAFTGAKRILIISDSKYVVNCGNGTFNRWANEDLWSQINEYLIIEDKNERGYVALVSKPEVNFKWTKGHAGNHHNNQVDELARAAMIKLKEQLNGVNRVDSRLEG